MYLYFWSGAVVIAASCAGALALYVFAAEALWRYFDLRDDAGWATTFTRKEDSERVQAIQQAWDHAAKKNAWRERRYPQHTRQEMDAIIHISDWRRGA